MTTRRLVLTRSAAVIGAASTGLLLPEIARNLGQQQASGGGTDHGSAAGQNESTSGHEKSPRDQCCGLIISERCAA